MKLLKSVDSKKKNGKIKRVLSIRAKFTAKKKKRNSDKINVIDLPYYNMQLPIKMKQYNIVNPSLILTNKIKSKRRPNNSILCINPR